MRSPPRRFKPRGCRSCHEAVTGWGSPGGVMDWGFPSNLPESRLRRLVLLLILVMAVRSEGCRVDKCSREFRHAMDERGIPGPEPSPEFCQVARDYAVCLKATARSCRGNLNYHSTQSTLGRLTSEYKCPELLRNYTAPGHVPTPSSSAAPPTTTSTTSTPKPQCSFQGRRVFRHCGLFGDPHLKTFENEYQTCRVRGAWPLIDNPFLAVQVTNEPVVEGSPATATTKVTIIVRGSSSNSSCSGEKTYEATSDTALPVMFIDGTQRSGPDDSVLLTVCEPQRVEIYIRYIETTLIVRKAGSYLAFSARMPEELVSFNSGTGGDYSENRLQLCVRGCPKSERLDPISERGHKLPWDKALERCRRSDSNEVTNNLTDHYLDWCVFDVMTTGDGDVANEFTAAAHSAQADVLRFDPGSLNRTTLNLGSNPDFSSAVSAAPSSVIVLLLVVAAMLHRTP